MNEINNLVNDNEISSNYYLPEVLDLYKELDQLKSKVEWHKKNYFVKFAMDKRCARHLTHFPSSPCPYALNTIYQNESSHKCEWFIVDEFSNYCFFVYSKFFLTGGHMLDEIADYTRNTMSSTELYLKKALLKTKKKMMNHKD